MNMTNFFSGLAVVGAIMLALLLAGCAPSTTSSDSVASETPVEKVAFGYDEYDRLLDAYVDERGFVDYDALMAERGVLDAFVASMSTITREDYADWSESEQIALWINAYNAITLQYILDNYPIEKGGLVSGALYPANSIRQIDGVWDSLTSEVIDTQYTLEAIEHEILRAEYNEPRIHFAIVCASIGCPPLRNEAFRGERLEEQLQSQTDAFLSDDTKLRIDRASRKVALSPIFKWFGKDFIPTYGTSVGYSGQSERDRAVLNFIAGEVNEADAEFLRETIYEVTHQDYDWSLNEQ